jgi:hypothetical protein
MISLVNTVAVLMLSCAAGLAVMSKSFRDGVVMKVGLIFISFGYFANFLLSLQQHHHVQPRELADAIVYCGVLICAYGYARRVRKSAGRVKRRTDWISTQ